MSNTTLGIEDILDRAMTLSQEDCLARLPQAQRDRILEEASASDGASHLGTAFWVVNPHYTGRGSNEKPVTRAVTYDEMLPRQCALYRLMEGNMERLRQILEGWIHNSAPTPRDGTLGDSGIEIREGKSYIA